MTRVKKIGVNSVASFIQLSLSLLLGLLTARLLIGLLGFTDFGVLTALGASGLVTTILNSGLGIASSRHLAYEVGLGENGRLTEMFSSTLAVFLITGIIILGLGLVLQPLIFHWLTIPENRLEVAKSVYFLSLAVWVISAITAPFSSLMSAHQDFVILSIIEVINRIGIVVLLLGIPFLTLDYLFAFALGTLILGLIRSIVLIIIKFYKYPSVKISPTLVSKINMKRILSFASWSFLSMVALELRRQLAIIVVNIQFGPIANAAYALGVRFSDMLMRVSGAIHGPLQPAMTAAAAQNNTVHLRSMLSVGCRFCTIVLVPIYIPLMLEAPYVLNMIFGEVPPLSAIYTRLMITGLVLAMTINGFGMIMNALDRVGEIVRVGVFIQISAFALACISVFLGASSLVIPGSAIIAFLLLCIIIPVKFGESLNFTLPAWWREVLLPIFIIVMIAMGVGSIPLYIIEEGFLRLTLVCLLSSSLVVLLGWKLCINSIEKDYIRKVISSRRKKNNI